MAVDATGTYKDLKIFQSKEARELAAFIQRNCPEEEAQRRMLALLYRVCIRNVTPLPEWYDQIQEKSR